jgi:hypothetical protein
MSLMQAMRNSVRIQTRGNDVGKGSEFHENFIKIAAAYAFPWLRFESGCPARR